jgi:nucleotide-binding universal stress UspA family protein
MTYQLEARQAPPSARTRQGATPVTATAVIVVGVDGSVHCLAALEWALREAADRRAAVRMIYVTPHDPRVDPIQARRIARQFLLGPTAHAHKIAPNVVVTPKIMTGEPADRLLAAASGATMLVVGARGDGGPGRPAPGSTARALATQAGLPLVVVGRSQQRRFDRIVLGVDARHPDAAPTRSAFEIARRSRARLTALYDNVQAQSPVSQTGTDAQVPGKEFHAALDRFADVWQARYPRTRLTLHTSAGMGGNALVVASLGADLLVIGGRRPPSATSHLGDITQLALTHAACPVMIVPYRPEWI